MGKIIVKFLRDEILHFDVLNLMTLHASVRDANCPTVHIKVLKVLPLDFQNL